MVENILFSLVKNMSVIVTFAYILSKNYTFHHIIERQHRYWKLFLTLFCIPLAISGTYLSIQILDALANIRSIGAIVGGIYGGPLVGIMVGVVAGFHRWSLGGFTAFACAVGVVTSGIFGGLYHSIRKGQRPTIKGVMWITALALIVEMAIVILLSRPLSQAIRLVEIITIPMTLSNVLGVGIFVSIVENAREENDHIKALQSRKALNIANQTLPYLRTGLNLTSAARVVEIIYQETGVDAVAITDDQEILAFAGAGADHHRPGNPIMTRSTRQTLIEGTAEVLLTKEEIGCKHADCPFRSAVITPLKNGDQTVGVLKLYRTGGKQISPTDVELARGISSLLSTQMEIARLAEQAQLTVEAELKALQTQINPHFLFNAINTIVSYCRTDPMMARDLLLKLSEVFRYTLQGKGYLCSLEEELKLIHDYMGIEQARFGDRVVLKVDVPENLLQTEIPRFSLQPLVENAIKHGVSRLPEGGRITISAEQVQAGVELRVSDNGIGIPPDEVEQILLSGHGTNLGIGLTNVHQRLMNLFGSGIQIESEVMKGTTLRFVVPANRERGSKNED